MICCKTDFFDNETLDFPFAEGFLKRYESESGFIKIDCADIYCVVKDCNRVVLIEAEVDWLPEQTGLMKSYIKSLLTGLPEEETGMLLTISYAEEIDTAADFLASIDEFTKGITKNDMFIFGLYTDKRLWRNRARVRAVIGSHTRKTDNGRNGGQ